MPYAIRLPDGTLVQNIPDDLPPEQAKRRIIAAGLIKAPETTVLGQIGEGFKGLVPGAVGLVESAAVGASALLPEDYEKTAREKIASIAGAAKAPFAASAGYEESVGRKLGESIGSFAPMLALGPLGLAGRAGMVGLGVGAGAGEARTRAEREGATAEERGKATFLGMGPGLLEVFAPFRILSRVPDAATAQGVQLVKRAALAGGEEAAQEAASNFAQNLIAKGVYKPEQELIEGLGEAAAYGGATGAIVQGLMDLALGRRARAAQPAPGTLPGETPIERAERLAAEQEIAKAAAQPPAPPVPTTAPAPGETAPVAEAVAPAEEPAAPEGQAPVAPPEGQAPAPAEEPTAEAAAPIEEPKVRKVGEPPATGLQPADIEALGVSKKQPIYRRMLGKDLEDPAQREAVLADIENYLVRGNGTEESRTKLTEFKAKFAPPPEIQTPAVPPAEAPVGEAPITPTTPPAAEAAPAQPETPSVAEAGGAGVSVAVEPTAVTPTEGVRSEPDGVVPPVADVTEPAGGEGAEPLAVTPEAEAPPAPLRGEYEPPVKAGLTPKREAELRKKLDQQRKELAILEAARDKAEGNIYLAEITGNEEAKARAVDAHEAARLVLKKATSAADRTYAQLFDMEKADFEGSIGEAYVADIQAEKAAREAATLARNPREAKGEYPYNLKTVEAVQEELRDQASHLPGYKELIEKYFTPTRELRKGKDGAAFVAEGQNFLDKSVLYQQTRTGPVDLENSKEMDDALRGKSFTESIDYAIRNARDDLDRQVLVKVKRRAEELENKGVQFSFALTAPGKIIRGALGLATTTSAGLGEATTVDIRLNGFTGDPSDTLSQETLVHELIHAVTVAQISYAPQGTAAIKLRALQQELVGIHNQRYKAGTLTATEKGVVNRALENDKELLAYGLTNGDVQNWLASITDPSGGTFLSRMFNIVSQVLGLKGKENSALARLMSISEEILDESLTPYVAEANRRGLSFGKQANTTGFPSWVLKEAQGLKTVWHKGPVALYEGTSIAGAKIFVAAKQGMGRTKVDIRSYTGSGFTPAELAELKQAADSLTPQASPRIAPATEAAVKDVDVIGEKERQTLTQRIAQDLKGNPALKLRMKFTDSLAPLEDFFVNAYGGATRTAKGRLNPMVLLSRALDSLRVSKAVQEQGGLGFDSGLIVAKDLENAEGKPVSYTGVLNRIAEAAKERGETYEAFRTKLDTVLYGHREHGLREMNKTLPGDEQVELLLPDAKIDELEAAFQKDDFVKGVLADLDTIRFNLLDTLVETGRISEEQSQDYKDATGYIPFNRLGDYEKAYQSTKGANRGAAALRNIRSLKGSERQTTSPIENFSGLVDWATKEAMKNHAALSALKDMALMGAAFKRPTKPKTDSPGDMVTVYDNGKPVQYYVPDPAHFIAFSIQDPIIPDSLKLLQKGSQILRAGVTSMPPFAIKQVFDDIVRAYTYAGVKNNAALVKSVMLNFPKNWVNEIFQKKPKDIKNLEALGIVGTFDFSQQGNLKNILEEAGAKEEGLGSKIMRVMEAGAKASDLAVRQAVYDQVMKETGDKAQAESAAREIINFSRRGSSQVMNLMISMIPFFNAYARGMDKLATAAAGNVVGQSTGTARSMFYKRMGVLTSMGLLYALLMQDDEEYQNLPDHVRDTNWILPHGKELGFVPAIPIPAELAFFFKAIPERIVRYYKMYGTEEEQAALDVVGNLAKRGRDVFSSPNITPQLLRPLYENITNYSWFLDRPLESQAQQALRPFERYGTGTSDAMKALAKSLEDAANATGIEAFAVSPIKLENAVRGIFGTAAGLGLSMADMMINPGRTDRPLNQQLGAQLTGLSAVTKDPIGTRQLDFIYDLEKRVEQVNGTVNRLMERKPEDVDQFIQDNIGLYSIRGPVQGVMGNIRALNQAAMILDRDTSLSPEERRKRIDELRVEQNKLAQQAQMLRKMARDIQMGR
jgi:hypothetical protein